jgi:hypothetical protein
MNIIFIPVLWVCLNANCEFMQKDWYFLSEVECQQVVIEQRKQIIEIAKKNRIKIGTIEGTCVQAKINVGRPEQIVNGQIS